MARFLLEPAIGVPTGLACFLLAACKARARPGGTVLASESGALTDRSGSCTIVQYARPTKRLG